MDVERGQALRRPGQLVPFEFCMQFNFETARRVRDISTRFTATPRRASSHSPRTSISPTGLLRQDFRALLSSSDAQSSVGPRAPTGDQVLEVCKPLLGSASSSTQQLSSPSQASTPHRGYQTTAPPLQRRLEKFFEPVAVSSPRGLQSVGTPVTPPEQTVRIQLAPLVNPPLAIPAESRSLSSNDDHCSLAEADHGFPTKRRRELR